MTEKVLLEALRNAEHTERLMAIMRVKAELTVAVANAETDNMERLHKTATENQKSLEEARTDQSRRLFKTVVSWSVGALIALLISLWMTGALHHALKDLHLPLPGSALTGGSLAGLALSTVASRALGRKIRRWLERFRFSAARRTSAQSGGPDAAARPQPRQDRPAREQGNEPERADAP